MAMDITRAISLLKLVDVNKANLAIDKYLDPNNNHEEIIALANHIVNWIKSGNKKENPFKENGRIEVPENVFNGMLQLAKNKPENPQQAMLALTLKNINWVTKS